MLATESTSMTTESKASTSTEGSVPPVEPPLADLTDEQVRAALWPRTFADLKYRSRVFSVMARTEAEKRQKAAKSAKSGARPGAQPSKRA
jgi:hypothetical protein